LIAPFHDPLRIAEDFCVLDNISRGRVDLVVAGGYVHEEFEMFDVPLRERPRRVTEVVQTLKAAFRGDPFEYRGRIVQITPPPFRPGGPPVMMGGASEPAARRAARIADGFVPPMAETWAYYRDEMQLLGKPDPGPCPFGATKVIALSRDPAVSWNELAPYFMHETNSYGEWQQQDGVESPYRMLSNPADLAATGMYDVMTPAQMIAELKAMDEPSVVFHPLCGGIPVDLAWESLRIFETEVLPAFR
jgi:alkanesulfonate monooxygenase SsuD/methylene tetrahydromethanopterin reductase-like flavin-dependent oxidoreductase (luciferase family)